MDPLARNVAQRLVDHALALDPAFVGKGGRFDGDGEMRFPAPVIAHVAAVLCAVVDDFQPRRVESFGEQALHFLLDGFRHAFVLLALPLYGLCNCAPNPHP